MDFHNNQFPFTHDQYSYLGIFHFFFRCKIPIDKAETTVNNIREGNYKLLTSLKYESFNSELDSASDIIDILYHRLIETDTSKYFGYSDHQYPLPRIMPSIDLKKSRIIDHDTGFSYLLVEVPTNV